MTVIMPHDSQCQSQPHDSLTSFYVKVMMYRFMSRCHNKDILNNICHICIQNVIIERKTFNDTCHKHA